MTTLLLKVIYVFTQDLQENRISPDLKDLDHEEFEDLALKREQTKQEDELDDIKESQKYHEKEYNISKSKFSFSLYEVMMVALLIIYLLNCYYGKTKNDILAQQWFVSNKEFFIENYAHIGIGSAEKAKESLIL